MKQNRRLEIIGILSLSLMLTSTFAVSSCVPEMMKTFHDYDRSSVELLISSSTFSVILMIALTPILSRYLSERFMVVTGLLIYGICGSAPFFLTSYPLILASRIVMGIGVGMVNAKAVSMIGERFEGNLRSKLLGIRCSMETIGQTVLMLAVGQLLYLGWNYAFIIYTAAFVILGIYLAFVPDKANTLSNTSSQMSDTDEQHLNTIGKEDETKSKRSRRVNICLADGIVILSNFSLGFTLVSAASINNLRITTYVVESGFGQASDGANVLSMSVFAGFFGGLIFGRLMAKLGNRILPLVLLGVSAGMTAIGFADTLIVVAIGTCICNFCITLGTSYMFNRLSENLSTEVLGIGNSIVLVGCNLGACTISFVLQAISLISPKLTVGFFFYAVLYLILSIIFFVKYRTSSSRRP